MINKIKHYFNFIKWKLPHCKHVCIWCWFRKNCMLEFDYELERKSHWNVTK